MKHKKLISAALALCMALPLAPSTYAGALDLVKYGDANGDTAIDISDMVTLAKYLHGKASNITLDLADINRDKSVDSLDLVMLRKMLLKSIKEALSNSAVSENSQNLTAGLTASAGEKVTGVKAIDDEFRMAHAQFALDLFKAQANDEENVMISPYSVMQALGMLANGAKGETLTQMEKGMGGIAIDDLNKYLKQWRIDQPNDKNCKLSTANSLWTRDDSSRIKVTPEFLDTTANQYNAEFFLAPFDTTTLNDINSWINDKTDEMIPKVLEDIAPNDVMFLINAVAFDAKWELPYEHEAVRTYDFTNCFGKTLKAEMLCGTESLIIHDENATGFYKYYDGRKYAFAALLPDEDITVDQYIDSLTPERFCKLFEKPEVSRDRMGSTMVKFPKFKYEYKTLLNGALQDMGMTDMFLEARADLTDMTSVGHPFVDRVIHDTFIQLDEDGTKAAAVTVIATKDNAVAFTSDELIFDRPFVYAIVDTETNMPVFMGTLMSIPD